MTPVRRRNTLCIVITLALGGGVSAILPAQTPAPRRNIDSLLARIDRKSTRLNSSHVSISYAVFCLKKKKEHKYADASCATSNEAEEFIERTAASFLRR